MRNERKKLLTNCGAYSNISGSLSALSSACMTAAIETVIFVV